MVQVLTPFCAKNTPRSSFLWWETSSINLKHFLQPQSLRSIRYIACLSSESSLMILNTQYTLNQLLNQRIISNDLMHYHLISLISHEFYFDSWLSSGTLLCHIGHLIGFVNLWMCWYWVVFKKLNPKPHNRSGVSHRDDPTDPNASSGESAWRFVMLILLIGWTLAWQTSVAFLAGSCPLFTFLFFLFPSPQLFFFKVSSLSLFLFIQPTLATTLEFLNMPDNLQILITQAPSYLEPLELMVKTLSSTPNKL